MTVRTKHETCIEFSMPNTSEDEDYLDKTIRIVMYPSIYSNGLPWARVWSMEGKDMEWRVDIPITAMAECIESVTDYVIDFGSPKGNGESEFRQTEIHDPVNGKQCE